MLPYRQLYGFIRADMESSGIKAHLPGQGALPMQEFGMALVTVRKAFDEFP